MTDKEEYAIVLDYLPYGYPIERNQGPIAQAIGIKTFALLELVPRRGLVLETKEKVYIGPEKRDKIYFIRGKLPKEKLTETAKVELDVLLKDLVEKNEQKFVAFFNNASPINARRHQIELLPGIGKKHMWEILEIRKEKQFESLHDIKERVKLLPDPEKIIIKRILMELNNEDKYRLFVGIA